MLGHATLNFDGTSRRIDGAGELDQHAVAGCLDDASAMLSDFGIDERFSESLEMSERAFLVGTHQTAIASDIRRQNSRQSPFHALVGHDASEVGKSVPNISQHFGPVFGATRPPA